VTGDPEHARDLYAAAAAAWAESGHERHGVFLPSHDSALVDAWFRLSFGASGVLAMRETVPEAPAAPVVAIRAGSPEDLELAARLDMAMSTSMVPSPSFSTLGSSTREQLVEEWSGTWEEEQFVHFVAELDGRAVGHILLYKRRTISGCRRTRSTWRGVDVR
jgi:hypothetical protein